MKNKLILVSTMLAAASAAVAAIGLTENISLEGFVDMSYSTWDYEEGSGDSKSKESDNSFTLDQAEIDFLFDFSPVTAQIDIQYFGGDNDEIQLEQAFASYDLGNGGVVTGGRYVSFLGFEAVEPTGLYQYSYAYSMNALDSWLDYLDIEGAGLLFNGMIPGYNDGVKYTVETDTGFFGISLQDGVWVGDDRLGGDDEGELLFGDASSNWGAEIAAAFTGTEGLTLFVGGAYEEIESDGESFDAWVINSYVSYESGAMTYGAELNYGEVEDFDQLSGLLMANFAYSEQASVTGRISYLDADMGDDAQLEAFKLTAAHTYAFTDNLALVAEISYVDGDVDETYGEDNYSTDFDELSGAVELLFSF